MKTSVIRQRVADFLKQHAPFDSLPEQVLLDFAGSGKVKFHESDEFILQQGEAKGPFVWMIQQGRVELIDKKNGAERLCDVRGAGDLLGLEHFSGTGYCRLSARTATDVMLYGIPTSVFEEAVNQYPALQNFLAAHQSVSGAQSLQRSSWLDAEAPPVEFLRARLSTMPESSSWDAALAQIAMVRNDLLVLVEESGRARGILTPLALCRQPGASLASVALPVPPAIAPSFRTREAIRAMLRARSERLLICDPAVSEETPLGVLSAAELSLFCGFNPAGLCCAIRRAATLAELLPLLQQIPRMLKAAMAQPQDVDDTLDISSAFLHALTETCIRWAEEESMRSSGKRIMFPHCWVLLGSSARGEAFTIERPTVGLIYDDAGVASSELSQFESLTKLVARNIESLNLSGTEFDWPEGFGPCMGLSGWKQLFAGTVGNPFENDFYGRRALFDIRHLTGTLRLFDELLHSMQIALREQEMAIPLFANDTLENLPPLTFFQGLVLSLDGIKSESVNLQEAVLTPLANAARVFALAQGQLQQVSTLDRLASAREGFPEAAETLQEAGDAFRVGIHYQCLLGADRLNPSLLGKFDQMLLKTTFASIQRFLDFTVSRFIPA